jgi:ACS family pantothenate transporter-like MFS transporter
MTVPVGLATYVFLPDTPHTTRAWFLTQDEKDMAAARVLKAGKAAPAKITAQTFKRILSSWKWYAFVLGYVVSESLFECSRMSDVKLTFFLF